MIDYRYICPLVSTVSKNFHPTVNSMQPSIGADGLYLDCALLSDEAGWNSQRLWDVSDIVL